MSKLPGAVPVSSLLTDLMLDLTSPASSTLSLPFCPLIFFFPQTSKWKKEEKQKKQLGRWMWVPPIHLPPEATNGIIFMDGPAQFFIIQKILQNKASNGTE